MLRTQSKPLSLRAEEREKEMRKPAWKAGLLVAFAVFFLAAASLVAPERHAAQAASIPGPVQQGVAALPDAVACDFGTPSFSSAFVPFGINTPFFNQGFFNQGFF